ncbi:unnamed protein product [Boreogadus saida]
MGMAVTFLLKLRQHLGVVCVCVRACVRVCVCVCVCVYTLTLSKGADEPKGTTPDPAQHKAHGHQGLCRSSSGHHIEAESSV